MKERGRGGDWERGRGRNSESRSHCARVPLALVSVRGAAWLASVSVVCHWLCQYSCATGFASTRVPLALPVLVCHWLCQCMCPSSRSLARNRSGGPEGSSPGREAGDNRCENLRRSEGPTLCRASSAVLRTSRIKHTFSPGPYGPGYDRSVLRTCENRSRAATGCAGACVRGQSLRNAAILAISRVCHWLCQCVHPSTHSLRNAAILAASRSRLRVDNWHSQTVKTCHPARRNARRERRSRAAFRSIFATQ